MGAERERGGWVGGNNNSTVYSLRWQYLAQISDNLYAHRMRARGDIVLKNEFMRLFMTSLRLCFCFCFSFSFSCCSASSSSSYCFFVFVSSSICNSCFVFNWSSRPPLFLFFSVKTENSLLQCKLFFPHAVRG